MKVTIERTSATLGDEIVFRPDSQLDCLQLGFMAVHSDLKFKYKTDMGKVESAICPVDVLIRHLIYPPVTGANNG